MLLTAEFDTLGAINEGRLALPAGPLFKSGGARLYGADAAGDGAEKRAPAAAPSYAGPERADTGPVSGKAGKAAEITEKRGFL